ncbi:MAG: hypothetical protein A2Z09_05880 [Nitrospirae bacterium RBG_16_43_8]|nr:MAG: hypothetical protein A2Z09_05880 [Nitrospirae bacterium RBG_16_43_8]
MKKLIIFFLFLVLGCAVTVTPEGTYIEPLPVVVGVGPSVVLDTYPPELLVRVRPLPSVIVYGDRNIYFYSGIYYHYWGNVWYFGEREIGPWYKLPPKHYPKYIRRR